MIGLFDARSGYLLGALVLLTMVCVGLNAWLRGKNPNVQESLIAPATRGAFATTTGVALVGASLLGGIWGITLLCLLLALLLLREFLAYGEQELHTSQAMIVALCLVVAVNFWFAFQGWALAVALFIPLMTFFVLPLLHTFTSQGGFLQRTALVQWGLMLSAYGAAYPPLIAQFPAMAVTLNLAPEGALLATAGTHILLTLLAVVPLALTCSYIAKTAYRKVNLSFPFGLLVAALLAAATSWLTPFSGWQNMLVMMVIYCVATMIQRILASIADDRDLLDFTPTFSAFPSLISIVTPTISTAPVIYYLALLLT